jgi:exopolyphosphatase/guanosine-5'-triphosphate,3'-diphosphate pyrophosphatase
MKFGVIDIGSNSVRLLISENLTTIYKRVKTTKLAKGMVDGKLSQDAVERTVCAVSFFVDLAKKENVDKILCYATAAVRNAENKSILISKVKELCGVDIDVIDGQTECLIGAIGALDGEDGSILDIGGASSEIAVVKNGKIVYSHSLDIGAVKLTDICGQDRRKAEIVLNKLVLEYGNVKTVNLKAIGGTATTITAMLQQLEGYDTKKTHNSIIGLVDLQLLTDNLYLMSIDERKALKGLQPERADIIANGALILLKILKYLSLDYVTVSEKDNLEGYLHRYLERK